ncbi:MAG: hypothetical protein WB116_04140 [Candidatus Dormiibacterota bacterium]
MSENTTPSPGTPSAGKADLSGLTRKEIVARLDQDDTGGFTRRNVREFARDGRLTEAELERHFPSQSTFGAVTAAQIVLANTGGINALTRQMVSIMAGAGTLKAITEPLKSMTMIGHQYEDLIRSSFANLGAAPRLHQLDIPGSFINAWAANLGHMENLLPTIAPISTAFTEAISTYVEPTPVVPLGPTVAHYQLRATYELHDEFRAQLHLGETAVSLLQDVKSEFVGQRQDRRSRRKLKIARLAVDIVLAACGVAGVVVAIVR